MSARLLNCLARAALKHGVKFLLDFVPGGVALYDMAVDVYEEYHRDQREGELRAEVELLAQASTEQVRHDVAAAVHAAAASQPAEVQQAIAGYLAQVPAAIRRSLRRPSDPSGTSMPASLALARPEDLLPLLPPRPPRFKPGDRPLPGVDWVLEELVGMGGFGEVWRARHAYLQSKAPVALKFCLDKSAMAALRNEAGVLDRVMRHGQHVGIVPLLHTYLSADPPCLEYEYVEGGDLAGLIQELHARGRMPAEMANRLLLRLAKIVAHAHGAAPPIVHGDLKPANVLVRRSADGTIGLRVTDFGIGGVAAAQAVRASRQPSQSRYELLTEAVRGAYTPLYGSPEQMRRRPGEPADPRDDVHALGVIWLQLLTGDLGMLTVPADWREQVEERGLDDGLVKLLAACLASKAAKRPASAALLVEQLRAILPAKPRGRKEPVADRPEPRRTPADDLAGQLQAALDGVAHAHATARRLAEQEHDVAAAVAALEKVPEHLRDGPLYAALRTKHEEIVRLDAEIRQAVRDTQLTGLRPKVAALLRLQPGRDDLRRLLERLPKEPGEVVTVQLGQIKSGGLLGIGSSVVDVAMTFAWCPPGTFLMGGNSQSDNPQHRVAIGKGFWMGIYAVTQAQWQAVMGGNPSHFKGDDRPVERVSWDECQEFCKKLGQMDGQRYRLPTEAEWEYACRAGTTGEYFSGNGEDALKKVGWYSANSGAQTHAVGEKKAANAWGLFDVHGNVWEWCADWYGPLGSENQTDPTGPPNGDARVMRGGSWYNVAVRCRAAFRDRYATGGHNSFLGLRVCFRLD